MIRVNVLKPDVVERKGVSTTTGKPYHLRIQTAYLETVDEDGTVAEIPDKFEFLLDAQQAPWPRGRYQLHPSAVYVDRSGSLSVRARFAPIPAK